MTAKFGTAARHAWITTIAASAALSAACSLSASAQTIDQIYEAAKAEKTVVLWGAGPSAGYESAARAFEQQFPGVTVSLMGGFSNVLNAKVEEQFSARKVETDLLVFQTVQDFVNWNKRGLLLHFKPEGFETIGANSKDPDGGWIAVNANPIFYGYNSDEVAADAVPKSALDFLKPQFKGKLISAYPADDDATLYDFYTIVRKYGWSYMDRYMAQQPKFIQGHLGVARSLGSGESLVSFDNTIGSTNTAKREGGKIALAAPASDRHADVLHLRGDPQGRAASQRRQALCQLVSVEGAAEPHRRLLLAQRRAAARRPDAALRLSPRRRLSQVRHQREAAGGAAPALREIYRPGRQCGRGEVRHGSSVALPTDWPVSHV